MTAILTSSIHVFSRLISITLISVLLYGTAQANSTLDELFFLLKHTTDSEQATKIERKIWKSWMQSGNTDVDAMMNEVMQKRDSKDYNGAIIILNRVIAMKSDYSEAWNQRATMYYLQGYYEESLVDIEKTLELEPRHFGSLSGRAMIRMKQMKPSLARQNIIDALKIHPFIKTRHMFPGLIRA